MSIVDMATDVQFTVDRTGKVTAVVIPLNVWQHMLALLEDSTDRDLVRAMRERLQQHPAVSGALRWEDVEHDWA